MGKILLIFILLIAFWHNSYAATLPSMTHTKPDLRFGVTYYYPPFVFRSLSGAFYGFDIQIAESICQEINARCVFIPMSLSDLFKRLDDNKVDAIISAISITPEREAKFDFTKPYFNSTMSYLTLINSHITISYSGLHNKKIGAVKGSTFYSYLKNTYKQDIQLQGYGTIEEAIDDLSNRKIDLVLLDTPTAKYWVNHSAKLFKIIGIPVLLPTAKGYGIAVKKDNTELLKELNTALSKIILSGKYEKIKQIYFSLPLFRK